MYALTGVVNRSYGINVVAFIVNLKSLIMIQRLFALNPKLYLQFARKDKTVLIAQKADGTKVEIKHPHSSGVKHTWRTVKKLLP